MPFVARFAAFRSQKWVDVRDRVHVEAPDGWIATEGPKAEPISVTDVTSAEPVRDNLPAFARAVRGRASYPIAGAQMVDTIAFLEAVVTGARSEEPVRL